MARLHREDFATEFLESNMIVPPPLSEEKEIMLEAVARQPRAVESMPDIRRDDKDFLRAVASHKDSPQGFLKHFSQTLRSDAELMIEVFGHPRTEMSMMKYCSEDLRDDKDFVIQIVERKTFESKRERVYHNSNKAENQALQYASSRLRDDSGVVMSCIRQCPMNLQHASDDIRCNKEIVVKAGLEDGNALLLYRSDLIEDGLLDQKELARTAVCADAPTEILQYCLERHSDDKEVVLCALLSANMEWSLVPEHLLSDEEFLLDAISTAKDGGKHEGELQGRM